MQPHDKWAEHIRSMVLISVTRSPCMYGGDLVSGDPVQRREGTGEQSKDMMALGRFGAWGGCHWSGRGVPLLVRDRAWGDRGQGSLGVEPHTQRNWITRAKTQSQFACRGESTGQVQAEGLSDGGQTPDAEWLLSATSSSRVTLFCVHPLMRGWRPQGDGAA